VMLQNADRTQRGRGQIGQSHGSRHRISLYTLLIDLGAMGSSGQ
jgi:hypothetical protein